MTEKDKQPLSLEMTIERLTRIAATARGPMKLGVQYDPGFVTAGQLPVKHVQNVYPGIDWDMGTVFLDLGERLCASSEDQAKLRAWAERAQNTVGMIGVALGSSLSPEGKLKAIQSHVDEFIGRPRASRKVRT